MSKKLAKLTSQFHITNDHDARFVLGATALNQLPKSAGQAITSQECQAVLPHRPAPGKGRKMLHWCLSLNIASLCPCYLNMLVHFCTRKEIEHQPVNPVNPVNRGPGRPGTPRSWHSDPGESEGNAIIIIIIIPKKRSAVSQFMSIKSDANLAIWEDQLIEIWHVN